MNEQNKEKMLINASLTFAYTVDMTEFNQQTMKVEDIEAARKEYLDANAPKEKVKALFNKLKLELEAIGVTCEQLVVYATNYTPELEILNHWKYKLLENIENRMGGHS